MDKFESSYSKYAITDPYKISCSKCQQLYVKANDEPFVCLTCSGMSDSPWGYDLGGEA
jgi:hypothetical protein